MFINIILILIAVVFLSLGLVTIPPLFGLKLFSTTFEEVLMGIAFILMGLLAPFYMTDTDVSNK